MALDIDSRSRSEKVILLSLRRLERAGATPAQTHEVIRTTKDLTDEVDVDLIGTPSEADVSSALNRLEADGYVEKTEADSTSPVGKGRPAYALAVDSTHVVDDLSEDEEIGRFADQLVDG